MKKSRIEVKSWEIAPNLTLVYTRIGNVVDWAFMNFGLYARDTDQDTDDTPPTYTQLQIGVEKESGTSVGVGVLNLRSMILNDKEIENAEG